MHGILFNPEFLLNSKTGEKPDQLFEDSVKTYYTEGTPLDTPYVFSTATSMSDLRSERCGTSVADP
jgi:hypothetical protein